MWLIFQSYFYNDDTFNFNYAQAKAAMGNFSEAEEVCIYFLSKTTMETFPTYSPLSFLFSFQIFTLVENKQVVWNILFPLEELKLSVNTIQKRLSC